jgi:cellulose synthase/poly-beta-1,6-N-acetylglucosamine synthase-like glycosyltransferase
MAAILFVLCASGLVYVLAGYPLLLAWLARRRERPVRRAFTPRSVTVLLAVHNGAPWLAAKLESILALDYRRELMRILVISDGSDDGTEDIALEYRDRGVELVAIPRGGKAAALNAGLARASGDILLFTDVRQTLARDSLRRLVACFADADVGAVSGELILSNGSNHEEANVGLYWRYEKWIRGNLSRIDSVPGATGCLYAMRRTLARPMPAGTLLDDVYLPLQAFRHGYRVVLEAGALAFDAPAPLHSEFARKVRTQAGVLQVVRYCPWLLGRRNRMLFHFLSHKIGRLGLPYLLLGVAAASFGLPAPWRSAMLAAQAAVYGLALADAWIPARSGVRRITAPLRTFLTLVAAALFGWSILFLEGSRLWKPAPESPPAREPGADLAAARE